MSRHNTCRQLTRSTARTRGRNRNRCCLRGRRHGPDDLSQALTALGRALRAHRRLARLAPSFFDSAVVDREAENRAENRRWMSSWEPALAKAYGVEPRPPRTDNELPRLPSVNIQRQVDLKLAEREMSIIAGREAMERYQQRQPHAVMSWSRIVRLLKIGFEFGNLARGLDSPNRLPEKIAYDYELTNLKRGYGHLFDPAPPTATGGVIACGAATDGTCGSHPASRVASTTPPSSSAPTAKDDRSLAPASPPAATGSGHPLTGNSDLAPAASSPPVAPRCDAWRRWAKTLHQMKSQPKPPAK
jgi:hypothetical protein